MPAIEMQHFDILSSPQTITASLANIGNINNMLGWDEIAVFVKYTSNDSTGIQLKPYSLLKSTDTDKYELPNAAVGSTLVSVKPLIYTLASNTGLISFDVQARAIPFIGWQVMADSVGETAGTIDKIWAYATARI